MYLESTNPCYDSPARWGTTGAARGAAKRTKYITTKMSNKTVLSNILIDHFACVAQIYLLIIFRYTLFYFSDKTV